MGDDNISKRDAFAELLAPIHERAQMTARRLCRSQAEGDDVFQEAAMRALSKIGELRDAKAFPAWFYRIMLSVHRRRHRGRFWRRFVPLDDEYGIAGEPAGDDGGRWEDERQSARRMRAALAKLPPVQREAVVLCDIDGYSMAEVAEMQAASLSAVKSRVMRGRAVLRRIYDKERQRRERGDGGEPVMATHAAKSMRGRAS